MQWKTHVFAGLSSLWLLELFPSAMATTPYPLCAGLAAFGALLPDLDAQESRIRHLGWAGVQPFMLPAQAISSQFGHRGFLHSGAALVLLAVVSAPIALGFGWPAWFALILGYGSHLAADACTRAGIPFLYFPPFHPDRKRRHLLPRPLRFVTGSEAEGAMLPLLALFVLLLLLRHLATGSLTSGTSSFDFGLNTQQSGPVVESRL